MLEVGVADTGPGICGERLRSSPLFDLFFTQLKSTGIGAWLLFDPRRIVEAHGGPLWGGKNNA